MMMDDKMHAPQIRFSGFSDDWEQRKLGEVCNEFDYGLNVAAKEYDGINKYLRITDIDDDSRQFNFDNLTSPDISNNENTDEYLLRNGDILFARTGASVGKTYLYKELDGKVYFAGFLIRAHVGIDNYPYFIFQTTLTEAYAQFVKVTSQRSGQPGINAKEYSKYKIYIPKYFEQQMIGTLFEKVDKLITLHQCKLDKLINIKKSMLEKMFVEKNTDVPEIRFKGFTDTWEQRKLGEVCNEFDYGLNVAAKEYDGINKYLRITDIDDDSRQFNFDNLTSPDISNNENTDEYLLRNGDILFARTGASVGKTYLYKELDGKVYFAGFLIRAHVGIDNYPYFIFQTTLTEAYAQFVKVTSQRSGQPGINAKEYSKYKIYIPKYFEQQMIGTLFEKLDKLITLHQCKLEKLKNIKTSCLEKMFV